jgi:hypothetical protein
MRLQRVHLIADRFIREAPNPDSGCSAPLDPFSQADADAFDSVAAGLPSNTSIAIFATSEQIDRSPTSESQAFQIEP